MNHASMVDMKVGLVPELQSIQADHKMLCAIVSTFFADSGKQIPRLGVFNFCLFGDQIHRLEPW
jgi:hypothetical protein